MAKGKELLGRAGEVLDDKVLPQVGKAVSNIDPEDTSYYLKNAASVNDEAGTIEGVKSQVDDVLSGVTNQKDKAKDAFDSLSRQGSDALADERYSSRLIKDETKGLFDDQVRRSTEALEKKTLAPIRDKILEGMDELKAKVSYQSTEAFQILENAGKRAPDVQVQIKPVISEIERGIENLKVGGVAVSDSANNSLRNLEGLKARLESIPDGMVSLKDGKRIIQSLDADQIFSNEKGAFAPEADAVKAQARHLFDQQLKRLVPAYGEKMEKVAADTALLSEMSQGWSTEGSVINRLNQLTTEKGRLVDLPRLKRFQEATGIKFESEIQDYLKSRQVLDSEVGYDAFKKTLPGYEPMVQASDNAKRLSDPAVRRSLE